MAIPALDSIIDEVQLEFNDASGAFATDALVTQAINEGYWKVVDKIIAEDLDFCLQTTTANLVTSTTDYTLTTGFIRMKKVEITYDGTNWYQAKYMSLTSDNPGSVYDETSPMWSFVGGSTIRIFPTPAADVTGGLKMYEYVYPTQLSGSSSPIPPLYGKYHLLKDYAFYKLYLRRMAPGDQDRAQNYQRSFYAGVDEIVTEYQRQSTSINSILVPEESFDGWFPSDLTS